LRYASRVELIRNQRADRSAAIRLLLLLLLLLLLVLVLLVVLLHLLFEDTLKRLRSKL
jgi:hypothetical protein